MYLTQKKKLIKKTLFTLILFCSLSQVFSQRFKEIIKWEIITNNGGIILGASQNEHIADSIINDFAFRNKGLSYHAKHTHKIHTVLKVKNRKDNPIQDLIDNTKRGYIVLSPNQARIIKNHEKKHVIDTAFALMENTNLGISYAIDKAKIIKKYWIPSNSKQFSKLRMIDLDSEETIALSYQHHSN